MNDSTIDEIFGLPILPACFVYLPTPRSLMSVMVMRIYERERMFGYFM